jgi:hypothetical protein
MLQIFYISDNNENCFAIKVDGTMFDKINHQLSKSIEINKDNPEVISVEFRGIKVYSAPGLDSIMEQIQEEYGIEIDADDFTTCTNIVYPNDKEAIIGEVISGAATHVCPNGLLCITGFSDRDLKATQSDYFGIDDFEKLKIDLTIIGE